MGFDAQRQNAQDVLVDAHLAFHLGHGGSRSVDVHQRKVSLAVLVDPVRERLDAPILDLADGSAILFDDGLELLGHRLDLLGRDVLTSKIDMLVESHDLPFSSVAAPARSPASPEKGSTEFLIEGGDTGGRIFTNLLACARPPFSPRPELWACFYTFPAGMQA